MDTLDNVKSRLSLKNIFFEKINFSASGEKKSSGEAQVSFELLPIQLNGCNFIVKLMCCVEVVNCFKAELIVVGEYEVDCEEFIKRFIPNAIAIIFPYLRSEVTLLTAQPNMAAIVIPAVNINALLGNVKYE